MQQPVQLTELLYRQSIRFFDDCKPNIALCYLQKAINLGLEGINQIILKCELLIEQADFEMSNEATKANAFEKLCNALNYINTMLNLYDDRSELQLSKVKILNKLNLHDEADDLYFSTQTLVLTKGYPYDAPKSVVLRLN